MYMLYQLYFTQQKSTHTCRFVPWYKVHCHWGKSRTYMYSILSHFSVTRTNLHMVQLHYRIRYRLFTRIHHAILFKLIENVTYIPSTQTHMYTPLCMWNWSAAVSYYIEHCKFLRRIHIYALTVIPYNTHHLTPKWYCTLFNNGTVVVYVCCLWAYCKQDPHMVCISHIHWYITYTTDVILPGPQYHTFIVADHYISVTSLRKTSIFTV